MACPASKEIANVKYKEEQMMKKLLSMLLALALTCALALPRRRRGRPTSA